MDKFSIALARAAHGKSHNSYVLSLMGVRSDGKEPL